MAWGEDWLKNGPPVFHDGKDRTSARGMIDRLGGPRGFKTAQRTNADGSVTTVQLKGDMPPQVTTVRKKSAVALALGYLFTPRDKNNMSGWPTGGSARAFLGSCTYDPFAPNILLHTKRYAEWVTWVGAGVVLSYDHGGNNRYDTNLWNTAFVTTFVQTTAKAGICCKGVKINTAYGVRAAAIFGAWLIYLADNGNAYYTAWSEGAINSLASDQTQPQELSPTWAPLTVSGTVADARVVSAWHFNPTGTTAACAVLYTSFGEGTWDIGRMRRTALPQAKRYLTFSLAGEAPTAVYSDAAFVGEPVAALCAGSVLEYLDGTEWRDGYSSTHIAPIGTSALTFTGKRLWGVDFAGDGSEIEVTFIRSGSGSVTAAYDYLSWDMQLLWSESTVGFSVAWGVYANASLLVEAKTIYPTVRSFRVDSASSDKEKISTETFEHNSIAIHDLDARFGFATVERMRLTEPGFAGVCTVERFVEHWLNNTKIHAADVPWPASASLPLYIRHDIAVGELLNYGPMIRVAPSVPLTVYSRVTMFPEIGGWGNENTNEWSVKNYWARTGDYRTRPHLDYTFGYPNQITYDSIRYHGEMLYLFLAFSSRLLLFLSPTENAFVPTESDVTINYVTVTSENYTADKVYDGDLSTGALRTHGLAKRNAASPHFLTAAKATYFRGFANYYMALFNLQFSLPHVRQPHTLAAHLFISANGGVSYTKYNLLPSVNSRVNADITPSTADAQSLRLDRVCVV